jgi:hypothetical protein
MLTICLTSQSVKGMFFEFTKRSHESLAVQKAKRRKKNSTTV